MRCATPAATRLSKHIDSSPGVGKCWPWTGAVNQNTGQAKIGPGRDEPHHTAPHVVLVEKLGRPLRSGYVACHTCDFPLCCNPEHLWEGTKKENSEDMVKKGRSPRGERQGSSKLTEADIRVIRADTRSPTVIGREWGISNSHICAIQSRKKWAHVSDE